MLAHPNPEVIKHVEAASANIIVDPSQPCPNTINCETCSVCKATEVISRKPRPDDTNGKPFYRMNYNLIDMLSNSYNGNNWVSHMGDPDSGFQLGYTHYSKEDAPKII